MARIYLADKETLDSTHANTNAILAALEESGGEHKKAVRYGIKISKSDSGKKSRVTYLYDAVGMTPAAMNYTDGTFNYGSWGNVEFVKNNYPCMVKFDGTEDYKLLATNYALKADGTTASDVANVDYAGNAMAAFKGGWLCQYETATDEYIIWSNVKYDDGYNAYHRTAPDGVIREGFYRRIYTPALLNNVARSLSGQQPMASKNASGSVGGYMKDTVMTKAGRFPVTYTGSSSTYLCDYFWLNTGIVAVPRVGGGCYSGLNCGACVALGNTAGFADWGIAPGLSCKMPNAA